MIMITTQVRICPRCRLTFVDSGGFLECEDCRATEKLFPLTTLGALLDSNRRNACDCAMVKQTQNVKILIDYLHGMVFDKATGSNWKKTYHFLNLIQKAEDELNKLRETKQTG